MTFPVLAAPSGIDGLNIWDWRKNPPLPAPPGTPPPPPQERPNTPVPLQEKQPPLPAPGAQFIENIFGPIADWKTAPQPIAIPSLFDRTIDSVENQVKNQIDTIIGLGLLGGATYLVVNLTPQGRIALLAGTALSTAVAN